MSHRQVHPLNPLVYWSQTDSRICFKVDLRDCQVDELTYNDRTVAFKGRGQGASGIAQQYAFTLSLFEDILEDSDLISVFETKVDIVLHKSKSSWWPQLLSPDSEKPNFLRVDFDRWRTQDNDTDSDEQKRPGDVLTDYPDIMEKLQTQELGYKREQGRKVYLVLYNLFQFVGFLYIHMVLILKIARDGHSATYHSFESVGRVFKFCQLMQFLEVLHPLFGYTRGGVLAPLMQTMGRAVVLFLAIDTDVRVQKLTIVTYLFIVWATIELVRYPYYLMRLIGVHVAQLEWIRYTLWIPLYPLGALYETLILLRAAEFMEATERFTMRLPNTWNVTFDMALGIRIYVLVAILPGVSYLMRLMQRARRKRFGSKTRKIN